MIFRQFLHTLPIGASYLFGCGGQSRCVVVDPVLGCGRRLSGKPASTIGFERLFNRAFATEERHAVRICRQSVKR